MSDAFFGEGVAGKQEDDAPDPKNLGTLEASLNSAARGVNAAWIAFLSVMAYLLVATLTVTPKSILLAQPVRMPFLGAELPIPAYFVVAPLLVIAAHFYLASLLNGMAIRTREFETLLADPATPIKSEDRAALRLRLDNSFFVRVLSERHESWEGRGTRLFFRFVAGRVQ